MKEYDRLETTEDGRVFRLLCKEVQPDIAKNGYGRVRDGNGNRHLIHRLVATQHLPNPDNKPQVNHKDKDRMNNKVSNLEWVTAQENQVHAIAKTWVFFSPTGERLEMTGYNQFCKDKGLNQSGMWRMLTGKVKQYKGYHL